MKKEISALVAEALAGVMPVLSLRGTDEFARPGGDLDFMTPPGKAITACLNVVQVADRQGWLLVCFRNIGYLAQVVLARPGVGGADDSIKIDFFDGLRWYGVGNDVAGYRLFEMLRDSQCDREKLSGVASFFQKVLVVGRVSERDWMRVAALGTDSAYLCEVAEKLSLPITRIQIEERGVVGWHKWRLRAASGGVSGPISSLFWFFRVSAAHAKYNLGIQTDMGLLLGVSGLDGSGKSTVVDRFISLYIKAGAIAPTLIHLLPTWIPTPHNIFKRHKTRDNYAKPYAEKPVKSRISAMLRLIYYLVAFFITRISLFISVLRGKMIIMDRSYLDFVSDLTRSRIPNINLPHFFLRINMPKGLLFFLDVSPEAAFSRKGELTLEKARSLRLKYRNICDVTDAIIIDGNEPKDDVFNEIVGYVSREYKLRIESASTLRSSLK